MEQVEKRVSLQRWKGHAVDTQPAWRVDTHTLLIRAPPEETQKKVRWRVGTFEVFVRQVEQNHPDVTPVVVVNHLQPQPTLSHPLSLAAVRTLGASGALLCAGRVGARTPAPTSMLCFHASPDRGAIRAYVPSGMAMARSVFTSSLPRAGTT